MNLQHVNGRTTKVRSVIDVPFCLVYEFFKPVVALGWCPSVDKLQFTLYLSIQACCAFSLNVV